MLDFHTHAWTSDNWRERPWDGDANGGRYMVTNAFYPPEKLLADGKACFPDRAYEAVFFGYPTPAVDWDKDTAYIAAAARTHRELWPLLLAGPALGLTRARYEEALANGNFCGFKVFLNWYGDAYGNVSIEEMVGPVEMELANERRLVLLLHVPRRGRLADPDVQRGVRALAQNAPQAQIVLAHCGRCYLPSEMKNAIDCLRGLNNVWMDTSMVMDPVVLQIAIDALGPGRLLFGTDFPVAAMHGRRVQIHDHWVDVVTPGYPASAYRVSGDSFKAGPMAWEIVTAIRWACELTGIKEPERHAIFYANGMSLLTRILRSARPCEMQGAQ